MTLYFLTLLPVPVRSKMNRSSQHTTDLRSPRPNPSDIAYQSGTVLTRVIPLSANCRGVQIGRDSGLGSTDTRELSSVEMSESGHHLVNNNNNSGSSASLSCEEHYPTVVEGPLLIETETQFMTGHVSTTRSSLSVADPLCVMSGPQSVPVQQSFMEGQQSMIPEQHFSMSGQIISKGSARASSSLSLKYPTQVASASDTYGSLPDYLGTSSVPSAAYLTSIEEELKQIVIDPHEYKEEFKEGQFDIVLVYSESDRDEALAFMEILIKYITLLDGKPPLICVLDQNAHLNYINSRFKHMEEALRRSTYMFLFLTKDFCGDNWAQLQRDECLMESIHNSEKKWCVVPILTKSRKEADYQLPFGLRALKGVEISHMLRGKTLNSVDVNALGPKDVDPFFLKNMTKMLNDRIYLRKEREKRQEVSLQNWVKEEKHRRWKEQQKEKLDNELRDMKHVTERQNLQKELEDLKMKEMMVTKAEAAKAAEKEAAECIRQLKITEETRFSERLQPPIPQAGPIGQKVTTKAATTVEYHHHYYGPVHQSPAKQTVYKIYGPVSNSQIGRENVQYREKEDSNHVLLDETNLETDAPESIEYIVVTEEQEQEEEETSTSLQQDAGLETTPVSRSASVAAECDDSLEGMAEQRPTAVLCSDVGQALALSSSSKSMHLEKDEMSTEEERSPEVDRPQSLPVLKGARNVLSHCWHAHGTDLPPGKSCSATGNSRATQNPMSSGTNVVDAGNSLQGFTTPQSFLSDQPVRPMAAVTPIRQKSLPEPSDDEQGEEMRLKMPWGSKEEEEETTLKSPYHGKSARPVNAETNVTHTGMDFNNRKTLTVANEKYQEAVTVAGQETSLKLVLNSAQACTSSVVLKTRVEKDETHRKPEDVVCEVPSSNEEKSKPEGAVELAESSFAGSSSVDPICSQSQSFVKIQTDVIKGCSNERAFYHKSPGSSPSLKVTAKPAAENKSSCTVS